MKTETPTAPPDAPTDRAPPPCGARHAPVVRWRNGQRSELCDALAEEVPVALEFNGISHAVMLATPCDLDDFALGFGLAEGILDGPADLYGCELAVAPAGITVQLEVAARCMERLKARRRTLAGRTGCGVCGVESLSEVLRPVRPVSSGAPPVLASAVARAMERIGRQQTLGRATGSTHAAAVCDADGEPLLLREDVGRHNALDKLIGAMARGGVDARHAFVAVTSRASVEMVQKACVAGVPVLAAISAPTALAVDLAERAGMALVGLARGNDLVVYAGAHRVQLQAPVAAVAAGAAARLHPTGS